MDELDPAKAVGIGGGGLLAGVLGRYGYRWLRGLLAEWRRVRAERSAERAGHIAELQRQVASLEGQMSGLRKHYEGRLDEFAAKLDAEVRARLQLQVELEAERGAHARTRDQRDEVSAREAALEARLMGRIAELEAENRGRDRAHAEMLQRAIETVLARREGHG
jgi:hypothetical protein